MPRSTAGVEIGAQVKRLYLFTVFHANFGFSSIPRTHYSHIMDRCLWPVMELLGKHSRLKLGIEFPAESLAIAAAEDPLFVETMKQYLEAGRLELIGSGLVQSILPLIPERANRHNLVLGQERYEALIGSRPVTAFMNEQVVSSSLLQLYRESGFQAVVLDWDNAQAATGCPTAMKYRPLRLDGDGGHRLAILWNSTVAFQKFQRYLHGEMELDQYLEFVAEQWSDEEDRLFCLYGGDWELIDYRPGDIDLAYLGRDNDGVERARLERLLENLLAEERFEWVLPREARDLVTPLTGTKLSSAATPLPTKKQPRYNPTRWAVSGRASPTANAECFLLYRHLRRLEALERAGLCRQELRDAHLADMWEALCSLWGSDFRTHTTTEKWLLFKKKIGHATAVAEQLLSRASERLAEGHDLAIFNPGSFDWEGRPFELRVHFAPGVIQNLPILALGERPVRLQVEDAERYRDGSLRKALLVFCPYVGAGERIFGTLHDGGARPLQGQAMVSNIVETEAVSLSLNPRKGGTMSSLAFPQICSRQLAGTIPHGSLPRIELTPDWYSGGLIIVDQNGEKITDLAQASLLVGPGGEAAPIRVPVRCRVETTLGPVWKSYYVYTDEPRLDLRYHLRLRDLRPRLFRLGILTINPAAFERKSLSYSTVNGYSEVECFPLEGQRVEHDQQVSFTVSARGCVGATEGWIDVSDGDKGLAIIRNLSELYTVPLVHYEEAEETYLLRIYLSAGESDETTAVLWRGHLEAGVTYYAHGRGDLGRIRREAEASNLGLQVGWGQRQRVTPG